MSDIDLEGFGLHFGFANIGGLSVLGLVLGAPSAAGAPSTVPTIGNLSPAAGSGIYKATAVEFDVTDPRPLGLVEIQVDQATREVVHDGDSFLFPYQGSSRTVIGGGYRFLVVRFGGWLTSPTFHVRAIDATITQEVLG